MPSVDSILSELETARDELRLKIHLGSKDLQDEWNELEEKYNRFKAEAELEKSAEDIGGAAGDLAEEIGKAYSRIKGAL